MAHHSDQGDDEADAADERAYDEDADHAADADRGGAYDEDGGQRAEGDEERTDGRRAIWIEAHGVPRRPSFVRVLADREMPRERPLPGGTSTPAGGQPQPGGARLPAGEHPQRGGEDAPPSQSRVHRRDAEPPTEADRNGASGSNRH